MSRRAILLLAVLTTLVVSVANALSPVRELADWEKDQYLTLQLTVPLDSGDAPPVRYHVVPLTEAVGMNKSAIAREVGHLRGINKLSLSLMKTIRLKSRAQ